MGEAIDNEFYMWGNFMGVIHHERGMINHIDIVWKTQKPYKLRYKCMPNA